MGVERSVHVGHAHVHELSVVCADEHVQPRSRLLAAGQRSRSTGPSANGILTAAVTPLAEAGISVFVLRMADQGDEVFLWAMLAEAAYEPEVPAVKDHPDLARYVNAWADRVTSASSPSTRRTANCWGPLVTAVVGLRSGLRLRRQPDAGAVDRAPATVARDGRPDPPPSGAPSCGRDCARGDLAERPDGQPCPAALRADGLQAGRGQRGGEPRGRNPREDPPLRVFVAPSGLNRRHRLERSNPGCPRPAVGVRKDR